MKVIHLSAECYPVAKVGGLGDVVGALPKYQTQAGIHAMVVMPCYDVKFVHNNQWEQVAADSLTLGRHEVSYQILKEKTDKLGFELYVVRIPGLIEGSTVYAGNNDTERFLAFQIAVLQWINQWETLPDVVHCHDHHTGLTPFMMSYCYQFTRLQRVPSVFTVHNGLYQGSFSWSKQTLLPAFDTWKWGMIDWNNYINPMAAGIKCCWVFTTVSQGYLHELQQDAAGLEPLIRSEASKSIGIVNGIDAQVWNPQTDPYISTNYTPEQADQVKQILKQELCSNFDLDPSKPLISFIGRLVHEKGADLLPETIARSIDQSKGAVNFLVLGSGADHIEHALRSIQHYFRGAYNCYIGYNEALSHLIYAASDFLIMPSRIEPCGLNQLYALRYGTIPIVRGVGGLRDTITDVSAPDGFGIRFDQTTVHEMMWAIRRAIEIYHHPNAMTELRQKTMAIEHSWEASTQKYINVYKHLQS